MQYNGLEEAYSKSLFNLEGIRRTLERGRERVKGQALHFVQLHVKVL